MLFRVCLCACVHISTYLHVQFIAWWGSGVSVGSNDIQEIWKSRVSALKTRNLHRAGDLDDQVQDFWDSAVAQAWLKETDPSMY